MAPQTQNDLVPLNGITVENPVFGGVMRSLAPDIGHRDVLYGYLIQYSCHLPHVTIKIKPKSNSNFNFSVALATFQGLDGQMKLVANALDRTSVKNISIISESSFGQCYSKGLLNISSCVPLML